MPSWPTSSSSTGRASRKSLASAASSAARTLLSARTTSAWRASLLKSGRSWTSGFRAGRGRGKGRVGARHEEGGGKDEWVQDMKRAGERTSGFREGRGQGKGRVGSGKEEGRGKDEWVQDIKRTGERMSGFRAGRGRQAGRVSAGQEEVGGRTSWCWSGAGAKRGGGRRVGAEQEGGKGRGLEDEWVHGSKSAGEAGGREGRMSQHYKQPLPRAVSLLGLFSAAGWTGPIQGEGGEGCTPAFTCESALAPIPGILSAMYHNMTGSTQACAGQWAQDFSAFSGRLLRQRSPDFRSKGTGL
eukprot:365758-Chlamydomonas_euryale.AAC.6